MKNFRRDFIKKTALVTAGAYVGSAAAHTGTKVTFDEKSQEVLAGGKIFKY